MVIAASVFSDLPFVSKPIRIMKMGISGSVTKMMTADVMSCTAMTIRVMGVSVTDKTRAGRYPVRYGPRPSTPRVTTVAISSRRGSRSRGLIAVADVSTPFLISATTRVDARCAYLVCNQSPELGPPQLRREQPIRLSTRKHPQFEW